ncbi:hypothetical protein C8Q76DRAFT_752594, partial [Earliella scabrosa]
GSMRDGPLNFDLLPLVASLTESRRTLCAMMLTCHSAYRICPRFVLQKEVRLDDDEDIHLFLRFMRAEKHRRWQYIRSLQFRGTMFSSAVAQRLARALPSATNLERLEFDNAEVTLAIDPSLPLALAALPNIKHLIIPAGERAAAFLETIHWPLETADLRENFHIDIDAWVLGEPELIDDWSPALLFKNARATLTSISSHYASDDEDRELPVYSKVTHLVIGGMTVHYPATASWSRAFPNVKNLQLYTYLEDYHSDLKSSDELIDAFRPSREHHLAIQQSARRWPQLESYLGTLFDLYVSGIAGRIDKLVLDFVRDKEWKLFAPVVAQARPRQLDLQLRFNFDYKNIPSMLRSPGLEELVTLKLPAYVSLDPEKAVNPGLDDFMSDFVRALQPLPVKNLNLDIIVKSNVLRRDSTPVMATSGSECTPPPPRPPTPRSTLAISCDKVDCHEMVAKMFITVPALQHVVFSMKWRGGDVTLDMRRPMDTGHATS